MAQRQMTTRKPVARRMSSRLIRSMSLQQIQLEAEMARDAAQGLKADRAVAAHAAVDALLDEVW